MANYQDSVILKFDSPTTGNASVGELITIKQDGLLANIYSDATLTTAKANPFLTDSDGFYEFFANDGTYTIIVGNELNPSSKVFEVTIGATDLLPIGVTLLSNTLPNADWIERNNQIRQTADYPMLAGTDGYPFISEPSSYDAGIDSNNGLSVDSDTRVTYKRSYINDGKTIATINGGSYFYSSNDGQIEGVASTSNANNLRDLTTDGTYVVGCGDNGRVEIFDNNTNTSLGNTTVGSDDLRYIEYNNVDLLWYLVDKNGVLYSSTNPFSGWLSSGIMSGAGGTDISIVKTKQGYVMQDKYQGSTFYYSPSSSLSSAGFSSLGFTMGVGFASNFVSTHDDQSDNGLIIVTGGDVYRTTNSGASYSIVSSSGMPTDTIINAIKVTEQVFVLLTSKSEVFYTTDFGDNFTSAGVYNTSDDGFIYKTLEKNIIHVYDNIDLRTKFNSVILSNDNFLVTRLESTNDTDKYYVKGR